MSNGLRSVEHSLNKENTNSNFTKKKFQMLFEQNIASNVTRNAGAQIYKT